MPEKLDRCVEKLKAKGFSEQRAFAICRASLEGKAAEAVGLAKAVIQAAGVEDPEAHREAFLVCQIGLEAAGGTERMEPQYWRQFVPITKIDEDQRLVYGILAEERVDKTGREILDFEKSKPEFLAWSEQFRKATAGTGQEPSAGNLRVMHREKVAGKFVEVRADEAHRNFPVCAKVLDDQEWEITKAGGYTGFSIGGVYGEAWPDPVHKGVMRYVGIPREGSLVDNPAMWGAEFELVRSAGATELRKFVGQPKHRIDPEVLQKLRTDGTIRKELREELVKTVESAQESANRLEAELRNYLAELAALPGPPDSWTMHQMIDTWSVVRASRMNVAAHGAEDKHGEPMAAAVNISGLGAPIGKAVRAAREKKSLSLAEAGVALAKGIHADLDDAETIRVTIEAWKDIESGKTVPDEKQAEALAQVLELDPDGIRKARAEALAEMQAASEKGVDVEGLKKLLEGLATLQKNFQDHEKQIGEAAGKAAAEKITGALGDVKKLLDTIGGGIEKLLAAPAPAGRPIEKKLGFDGGSGGPPNPEIFTKAADALESAGGAAGTIQALRFEAAKAAVRVAEQKGTGA